MAILGVPLHNGGLPLNSAGTFARIFFVALFAIFSAFAARAQTSSEYKLKAVFLFNFVQFVEWPTNAFSGEQSPIIIGVLGVDPFGKALEQTVQGEAVNNRKIVVRRFRAVDEIKECHVLFISSSETAKLDSILAGLKGRSILTVGDMENFANKGGMIRFMKEKNKIRFRINVESAKAANLSISSKLLQLAEIVPVEDDRR